MRATKSLLSQKQIEADLNFHAVKTALDKINSVRKSKYTPEGGYRKGTVFSYKLYLDLDIIGFNSRVLSNNMEGTYGRLMIFSRSRYWDDHNIKQFNKILRNLHNYVGDGIKYTYETDSPHGPSMWMKWEMVD